MQKSYYAIIPADIRYDQEITPNAKLLYGEITALCNERGYCWASNQYFSELYGVSKTTISKWINQLIKKGYVSSEIKYKQGSKEIESRYLRITQHPIEENDKGYTPKVKDPIEEKFNTPIEEKLKDNTTSINTTNNNVVDDIFNHYISKNIINHKKLTPDMKKEINKALNNFSYEVIIQAINNYAEVFHSDKYWFKQKYTLENIMRKKDIKQFSDEADPLYNFAHDKYKNEHSKSKKEIYESNSVSLLDEMGGM